MSDEIDAEKPLIAISYHHLALTCTNVAKSMEFYIKLGFQEKKTDDTSSGTILYNQGGLELHLFPTTSESTMKDNDNEKKPFNVLMDDSETKYPGHTHFCMGVGSVPQTRKYLETIAKLPESGQRQMGGFVASVFVRDPDRTVVELERNDGQDDGIPVTSPQDLSNAPRKGIDHIGTRVTNVPTTAKWYRQHLGLSTNAMIYDVDLENPQKNFRPWILRTPPNGTIITDNVLEKTMDINLIPNGTTTSPVNILTKNSPAQDPLPGIIYACYQVTSIDKAIEGLDFSYIASTPEALLEWGIDSKKFVNEVGKKSCFVRDYDYCVFRLVEM